MSNSQAGPAGMVRVAIAAILLVLARAGGAVAASDYGFDYLVLARQWGPTFCESTQCSSSPYNAFTIHGLWPNADSGRELAFCDRSDTFDEQLLTQQQLNRMACEWRSFKGSDSSFWAYEWAKHGTCALDRFADEAEYFGAALDLNQRYDINEALSAAGFDPVNANQITRGDLTAILEGAWGVAPAVTCYRGLVSEVRLCVDPRLQPVECPFSSSSCSTRNSLELPYGNEVPASCAPYFFPANDSGSGSGATTGTTTDTSTDTGGGSMEADATGAGSGGAASGASSGSGSSGGRRPPPPPPPPSGAVRLAASHRMAEAAMLLAVTVLAVMA